MMRVYIIAVFLKVYLMLCVKLCVKVIESFYNNSSIPMLFKYL